MTASTKECKPFEFACDAGQTCIDKTNLCDGFEDCNDETDEDNCGKQLTH